MTPHEDDNTPSQETGSTPLECAVTPRERAEATTRDVAEWDDRTSPEDQPEMMLLLTEAELDRRDRGGHNRARPRAAEQMREGTRGSRGQVSRTDDIQREDHAI